MDSREDLKLPEGCEVRDWLVVPLVTVTPDFLRARGGISSGLGIRLFGYTNGAWLSQKLIIISLGTGGPRYGVPQCSRRSPTMTHPLAVTSKLSESGGGPAAETAPNRFFSDQRAAPFSLHSPSPKRSPSKNRPQVRCPAGACARATGAHDVCYHVISTGFPPSDGPPLSVEIL